MNKSGVFVQLFLAVIVSICIFGLLTSGVFMLASRYQLKNISSSNVDEVMKELEELTLSYSNGEIDRGNLVNSIAVLETNNIGNVNIFGSRGELLYGQGTFVASVPEDEDSDRFFKWSISESDDQVSFTQINVKEVRDDDGLIATIVYSHENISSDFLRRSFEISLIFAMLVILPLVIVLILAAIYKVQQPISRFRGVVLEVARGNYDMRADEGLPGEVGELATTINYLSSNLQKHMNDLRIERNKLDHILDSLSEGILAVDIEGNVTHANKAAYYMLGEYKNEFEEYASWDDLYSRFIDTEKVEQTLLKGVVTTYTVEVTEDKVLRINITPLYDFDVISGATILIQDITESERLERTRRDYVSNVSHELRTPLTAMRGLIEPLADGMVTDDEDKQRYYGILLHETMRLSSLINDLLQLSRLQSGKEVSADRQFMITELIKYVFDKYETIAQNKSITLMMDESKEYNVVTREDRIEQLMIILLDNAMKFTPEGGSVGIDLNKHGNKLYVTVWDTGDGIAKEDLAHVFDRFFKADKAHTGEGTGLGLAIAKEIVENMGEYIFVTSDPGMGAKFTFTITDKIE